MAPYFLCCVLLLIMANRALVKSSALYREPGAIWDMNCYRKAEAVGSFFLVLNTSPVQNRTIHLINVSGFQKPSSESKHAQIQSTFSTSHTGSIE